MPDHEVALALLERTGPMAVSSANLSGLPAATEAAAAEGMLGDSVEVLLDAGPSPAGEASTILDVRGEIPDVLRLGALSVAALNAVLAPLGAAIPGEPDEESEAGEPRELDSMLVPELRAMARERGIKGAGSMRKAQLVEALRAEDRG
jgi:hypothetical protein